MQPELLHRPLETDSQILLSLPLMRELRGKRVRTETYLSDVREQQAQGYRLYGTFLQERLVALAGVRRLRTMARGWHLFVDDLVVDPGHRERGLGRALMGHLVELARAEGLPALYLDSRHTARPFYARLGFTFLSSTPCCLRL